MSNESNVFAISVWGALACFTRPEMKAERFSYPIMTPSAARGVFDAIYSKPPAFQWRIHRIEMLTPPVYLALRRNEVKEKASVRAAEMWMNDAEDPQPIWADGDKALSGSDEKGRTQRQTVALKDVRYRVHASLRRWPGCRHSQTALEEQFVRRLRGGKCFQQPYLGCREFPAYFELASGQEPEPFPLTSDIGWMLYDVFDLSQPLTSSAVPSVSLFRAQIAAGVLDVPDYEHPSVRKTSTSARANH